MSKMTLGGIRLFSQPVLGSFHIHLKFMGQLTRVKGAEQMDFQWIKRTFFNQLPPIRKYLNFRVTVGFEDLKVEPWSNYKTLEPDCAWAVGFSAMRFLRINFLSSRHLSKVTSSRFWHFEFFSHLSENLSQKILISGESSWIFLESQLSSIMPWKSKLNKTELQWL